LNSVAGAAADADDNPMLCDVALPAPAIAVLAALASPNNLLNNPARYAI
jgi:hypothetical protein